MIWKQIVVNIKHKHHIVEINHIIHTQSIDITKIGLVYDKYPSCLHIRMFTYCYCFLCNIYWLCFVLICISPHFTTVIKMKHDESAVQRICCMTITF